MTSVTYKLHSEMSAVHYYFYAINTTVFTNTYAAKCCVLRTMQTLRLQKNAKCILETLQNV